MKTVGDVMGTMGSIRDRNQFYCGYNDRIDHIVKCSECDTGLAFTDILLVRDKINGDRRWTCPHCRHHIDHVTSIIKRDKYLERSQEGKE